jgi:hypothetical protein
MWHDLADWSTHFFPKRNKYQALSGSHFSLSGGWTCKMPDKQNNLCRVFISPKNSVTSLVAVIHCGLGAEEAARKPLLNEFWSYLQPNPADCLPLSGYSTGLCSQGAASLAWLFGEALCQCLSPSLAEFIHPPPQLWSHQPVSLLSEQITWGSLWFE